jgi:hypothetical protein
VSFLTGLGAIGQGAPQGFSAIQGIQQRAQQIQQGQLALDEAKKKVAADAAAFSGIGGFTGGGMGGGGAGFAPALPGPAGGAQAPVQPMAPGQSSQPNMPTQGSQGPSSAIPPASPPNLPPPGNAVTSPPGSKAPGGTFSPQGQQQPGGIDPMAGVKAVMSIAQEIKSRNPNIDPQTLMLATERVIGLSHGMDPAIRQQAQYIIGQARNDTSRENTENRVGAQLEIAGQSVASRDSIAGAKDVTTRRGQDMNLQGKEATINGAMDRNKYVQGEMDKRFQSGQISKEKHQAATEATRRITAQLTAATRQLGMLKDATGGQLPETDPRVQKANRDIAEATAKLNAVEKATQISAPQPDAGGGAGGGGSPGTLYGHKDGKEVFQTADGKFVYGDGAEVK